MSPGAGVLRKTPKIARIGSTAQGLFDHKFSIMAAWQDNGLYEEDWMDEGIGNAIHTLSTFF